MQTYCVLIPGSDANRLLMLTYRMWKNKKCPNTQRSMVVLMNVNVGTLLIGAFPNLSRPPSVELD